MGTYAKHSESTKRRVIEAARAGEDWATVAEHRDVPHATALHWVERFGGNNEPIVFVQKGGMRREKIKLEHLDHLMTALGKTPDMTLKEMAAALLDKFDVNVTPQAVKKRIDGLGYTLKKPHDEPQYMNLPKNKQKRYEYLCKLYDYQSNGKTVFYMDETNINLWTARTRARSKKGDRAKRIKVSGGGQNMHVIACIGSSGLIYYESRFGANNAVTTEEFMRACLRAIAANCAIEDVLVVSDNAPCHTSIENVFADVEFTGASFLRLGPYSPMLNPIESVFSAFKAKVKGFIRQHQKEIVNTPEGMTMAAHRRSFLQRAPQLFLPEAATAAECAKYYRHSFGFHRAVFDKANMKVGN